MSCEFFMVLAKVFIAVAAKRQTTTKQELTLLFLPSYGRWASLFAFKALHGNSVFTLCLQSFDFQWLVFLVS